MKELTIVGRGESWKECLFSTEETWTPLTSLITEGLCDKKYAKVFGFDNDTTVDLKSAIVEAHKRGIPIVSRYPYATEPYPTRDIVKEFKTSYFMNTISYMIAYAVYLKYERIYIDGIDQGYQWDYQCAGRHVAFWIGFAIAKGIDLRLGRGSLQWAYTIGLKSIPVAFLEDEKNRIAGHIGSEAIKQIMKNDEE